MNLLYCLHVGNDIIYIIQVTYQKSNENNILTYLIILYSETSLILHSMGPENNVGLGGCWIMECFLPYLSMVTVSHIVVGLERMLDYRGVGL